MIGRIVVGDFRVQEVVRGDGRRAYTIVLPGGELHRTADGFLRTCGGGTDRTYGYLLVDHLRWLEFEGLSPETPRFGTWSGTWRRWVPSTQARSGDHGARADAPTVRAAWRPQRRP